MSVGQDPDSGSGRGPAYSINPAKRGDITESGKVWQYDKINRSISTAAVGDGLAFLSDLKGILHCLDVKTGKPYWTFDLNAPVWGSPLLADGKVYLGDEDGDLAVFKASSKLKKLAVIDMGGLSLQHAGAGQRRALRHDAVRSLRDRRARRSRQAMNGRWPCVRGCWCWPLSAALALGRQAAGASRRVGAGSAGRRPCWASRHARCRAAQARVELSRPRTALPRPPRSSTVRSTSDRGTACCTRIDLATRQARAGSTRRIRPSRNRRRRCATAWSTWATWTASSTRSTRRQGRSAGRSRPRAKSTRRRTGRATASFIGSYDEHLYCLSAATGHAGLEVPDRGPGALHARHRQGHGLRLGVRRAPPGHRCRDRPGALRGSAWRLRRGVGGRVGRRRLRRHLRQRGARDRPRAARGPLDLPRRDPHVPVLLVGRRGRGPPRRGRARQDRALPRASTGRALWTFATRARVDSSPLVVDGRVFVGSSDGNLYELDLATGKKVWAFTAGAALTASPAAAGGALVIGSQDGTVYCFR